MKTGIFRRIFISYAVIMTVAVLFIELYITGTVRERYINNLRNNLTVQANLISDRVPFESQFPLDTFCRQLKQKTGSRVTLINVDGRVAGDSESVSRDMDNHANRQEIREAAANGTGMAIRYSDTLKHDFLYVAIKVMKAGGPTGSSG